MLSPYPFLYPSSSLQDKEKESNQQALGINLSTWNRLLGTFPDCSPSRALEYSSSTSYASSSSTTSAWKTNDAGEDDASKHVETGAMNACADRPLLLQKQKYLISLGSKTKVSYIMLSPHHFPCPCSCLQNKEKRSNQSEPEIKRPIRN
ncbi:hypothetical protein COP1_009392 [Malus domestica]